MGSTQAETGTGHPEIEPCNKGVADAVSLALKWVDDGFKLEKVDEMTAGMRIAICEGCQYFIRDERRCAHCCCPMDFKVTLKFDPIKGIMKKTLITCPVDKW